MRRRGQVAEAVEETSDQLQAAMDEAAKEEAAFTAPKAAKPATALNGSFDRIVESACVVRNPSAEYEELETALSLGETRSEYGSVHRALDMAETYARRAHKLWMAAKIERQRWELDNQVVFGAMRLEATRTLEREKDSGLRKKQITDGDVNAMCASLYPDEYRTQELRRAEVKAMEESLQHLSETWSGRCKTLQTILSKQR